MRRAAAAGTIGLALVLPGAARADDHVLSLSLSRSVAPYASVLRFTGAITPAVAGAPVRVYLVQGDRKLVLVRGVTKADGTYQLATRVRRPSTYVARARLPDTLAVLESAQKSIKIRPRIRTTLVGTAVLGASLHLEGTLQPARSGVLRRTIRGVTRRVLVGPYGGFRVKVPTDRGGPVRVTLTLSPNAGYVEVTHVRRPTIALPYLRLGSRSAAVRILERTLAEQQYALRNVDRVYGYDTVEAVYAFQKVHRMTRSGRVTPTFWHILNRSSRPVARVARGDHIEVDKTRQVLFEVRSGKVVNVLHVSTGATGNTPVGTWHVYSKLPGFNALGMYYTLFFLRGFAIHGYHSVPPWPASHGCVRTPLWAAPGLYSRWSYGTVIRVFA